MKQEIKKNKVSLSVIAMLLLFKFLVLPIIDWQNEELATIHLLKNKQERIDTLLASKDVIIEQEQKLEKMVAATDSLFLKTSRSSDFQLEQQQWLESKISEFDVSLNNIGWTDQVSLEAIQATGYNVQLNLDGRTVDIIKLILEMQSLTHFVDIQSFNFNLQRQRMGSFGRAKVRLNLTLFRWNKQGDLDD